MYKLTLKLLKHPYTHKKNIWYLYDGPGYHSDQYDLSSITSFTSSSFQVSILLHGQCNDLEINFSNYLLKEAINNYKVYYVNERMENMSVDFKCANKAVKLYAFKFIVKRHLYVNITFSFMFLGPNIGYSKYGGVSVYDYVNSTMNEMFLSCENWFSLPLSFQPNRTVVSSTESLFLMIYSYNPYSEIEFQLQVEPSYCQGVNIER